jgi:hypothetical protein
MEERAELFGVVSEPADFWRLALHLGFIYQRVHSSLCPMVNNSLLYSSLSAAIGSILVARRAGT